MRPYKIVMFLAVIILACTIFAQPIQPVFMWFTDLMDTPADYTGDGGKILAVNAGETDIEFLTLGVGVGDMLKSTYDVAEDDFVDANDTIYASSWNGTINAPSMNAIYDYLHLIDTDDDGDVDNVDSGASPFGATIDDTELTAEDFGDFTSDGGEDGVTLDVNVVAAAELMSGDYGDIVIDGAGAITLDVNSVAAAELLSGDYGDVTIDGAGAITIDADSIALTTDTTGNYVLSITNGAGITGGDGGSEGAALTIAATLGTAIDTTEITDNTIEIADMNMLNAPADEDILVYDDATGGGFKGQTISEILNPTGDSYWLVGTGAGTWQWEAGATARTSIGLGALNSPAFSGITANGIMDVIRTAGYQLRLAYDGTDYVTFEVDSAGDLTLDGYQADYTIDFTDALLTTTGTLGSGTITSSGNLVIADAGYIGSASDTDAIQIEADGDVVLTQDLDVTGTIEGTSINLTDNTGLIDVDGSTFLRNDGTSNVIMGPLAGDNDVGSYNIFIGDQAGENNDTTGGGNNGLTNIYIGYQAGEGATADTNNTGKYNVALGYQALQDCTSGEQNFALGIQSLRELTSGGSCVAIGGYTAQKITTGGSCVAIGRAALRYENSNLGNNIAIGYQAGQGVDGSTTGYYNVFIGSESGEAFTTGISNVGIGRQTLEAVTTGSGNTCVGTYSGKVVNEGLYNTTLGQQAGRLLTTGDRNVFLGYQAGYRQTTGDDMLIIDNRDQSTAAAEKTDALIYGEFHATQSSQRLIVNGNLVSNNYNFAADAQGSDTYVLALDPPPKAYITGMMITFTANTANTGVCTVNVNTLGAIDLKMLHDLDPGDNYIEAGSVVMAVYDGANFQMIQPDANP